MENIERYKHLNKYLKEKFGERTLKICIDGGFTCPNRDGAKGFGGCIFCSEKGSGEHIKSNFENMSASSKKTDNFISKQVENYFKSYKAERANKFIVYFQNFTNTYDTLENLKLKYDSALIDDRIVGLEVATRPDCITEEIAKLLKSYTDRYYVCVELGFQTADEQIGQLINRYYTNEDFANAVHILNKYGIDVVTHIMIGLFNVLSIENSENKLSYDHTLTDTDIDNIQNNYSQDVKMTVDFLNQYNIQGLKIHSCYVVKNTKLEKLYQSGKYIPISLKQYLAECAYVITHINPNIIIHRVSGDAPKDLLVAPSWNLHKKWIINGLDKYLKENNLYQGMFYREK